MSKSQLSTIDGANVLGMYYLPMLGGGQLFGMSVTRPQSTLHTLHTLHTVQLLLREFNEVPRCTGYSVAPPSPRNSTTYLIPYSAVLCLLFADMIRQKHLFLLKIAPLSLPYPTHLINYAAPA